MNETAAAVQRAKEPEPPQAAGAKLENPLDRIHAVFEDVARRAFEIFEGNGRIPGTELENWFKAEKELLHPVNIELTEGEAAFEMKAKVPGFTEKDLEINVEPQRVTIAGKRETKTEEQKQGRVVHTETRAEQMLRVVELPAPIETGKVTATLMKNGILTITMPKAGVPRAVRITPGGAP